VERYFWYPIFLVSNHCSNFIIFDLKSQTRNKAIARGKRNESIKRLFVKPVEMLVAPATAFLVTTIVAVSEFEVLLEETVTELVNDVLPKAKLAALAMSASKVTVLVWLADKLPML